MRNSKTVNGWALVLALGLMMVASPAAAQVVVVADAGEDLDLECATSAGTEVTLDGTLSTVDGLPAIADPDAAFLWEAVGILFDDETSPTPNGVFPEGTTTVNLTVTHTDPVTLVETTTVDMVDVVIGDATPPTISALADPMVLWPPNHKLVDVEVELVVMDSCDPAPTVVLDSVVSNEPDNGTGDGNTSDDIQPGADDFQLLLRAERAGNGSGRIYAATYTATDATGNSSPGVVQILVPHDQGDLKAAQALEKAAEKALKIEAKAAKTQAKNAAKIAKAQAKAEKEAAKAAAKAAKAAAKAAEKAAKEAAKAAAAR